MSTLLFDIGGTNLRLAIAEGERFEHVEKVSTPKNPEEAITMVRAYLESTDAKPTAAYGGVAGIVTDGVVIDAPNLPEWNGFDFTQALEEAFGMRAEIHNDATLAALGEAITGAGRGYERIGYMTVGTGVGGALIVDGQLPPHDEAFEPGRQVIDFDTGRTLESCIGGAALTHEFGNVPEQLPNEVFDERTAIFATGLYNCIREWSPQIFILNGALLNDETAFRLNDIRNALTVLAGEMEMPSVVRAVHGDASGLVGAHVLSLRAL
jgi:glucokinase